MQTHASLHSGNMEIKWHGTQRPAQIGGLRTKTRLDHRPIYGWTLGARGGGGWIPRVTDSQGSACSCLIRDALLHSMWGSEGICESGG